MEAKSEKLKTENHNSPAIAGSRLARQRRAGREKFKTKTVLSFTLSLCAFRFTLFARVVACLFIFTFTITNVTYGYDRKNALRRARMSGREIAAVESNITNSNPNMGGGMRDGDLREYAQSATVEELIGYIIKTDVVEQIKVIRDTLKEDEEKLAEFDNLLAESGLRERYDRFIISSFMNFSIESVRNDKLKIKEGARVNIEGRDVIFTVNSRPIEFNSSNIYVTVGCSSCAPILCQASSSKGMTNHLLHFLTLDRDGGPAAERIYKPFKYVGNLQSIFVIAIDRKFEALFKELSQRLLAEYKNAKVLLIPVEKLEVKSAIFMQEGIAINAGKRDLYRVALPKKGTLKTVALRWDDVYKIYSLFQKNRVATVRFEELPKILEEIAESPDPQDSAAEETISNIVPPIAEEDPDENLNREEGATIQSAV